MRLWRWGAFVGVLMAAAWLVTASAVSTARAQVDESFEQAVRDCMDNGFSRDECVRHAQKVMNAERSDEQRIQQEQLHRMEEQSRPKPRHMRHPGRGTVRP